MKKTLNDSERLEILEEYLSSGQSKHGISRKYGIQPSNIRYWLRKFGLEDKPISPLMSSRQSPSHPLEQSLSESEKDEEIKHLERKNRHLEREIRRLKAELKQEALGHKAYKMLVELAEETYGIEIRKNSDAK